MSEPVTNAEIEDVLSAVRRLVSENTTPRTEATEERGKLVLTPAFRVDEAEVSSEAAPEPAPEVSHEAPREDEAHETSEPEDHGGQASVEALVQDALTETPEAVEDQQDLSPPEDAGEPDMAEAHQADHEADTAQDQPTEADHEAQSSAPVDETVASLEDRIAELEAVVNEAAPDHWEPDGSEEPNEETTAPEAVIFRHDPFGKEAERAAAEQDEATAPVAHEWEDVSEPAYDAEAYDEDFEDEADLPPLEEAVYAHAAHSAYAEPAFDEPTYDGEVDHADDDLVIDEDMLREIVGRLVREELQGTMGERITRNLRRMVRREIARALALREFE